MRYAHEMAPTCASTTLVQEDFFSEEVSNPEIVIPGCYRSPVAEISIGNLAGIFFSPVFRICLNTNLYSVGYVVAGHDNLFGGG
jgi:hypothetical protein